MANITRAALDANALINFPDNNTNYITPAFLRDWLDDAVDSFVTQKDTSRLENAIYENEGSALAAAATVNLASATGNFLHITGTGTISSFGTCPAGARFVLVFDGVCTLTYNATSLIIPGNSNKITAANDCCMIVSEGSGNWRVVGYFPIAGGSGGGTVTAVTATAPLASSGGNAPDISIQQASGSQNGYLSSNDFATFSGKQDALSAGTGISLASNTVTNTAPDQVVALTAGTGISTSGTYPNFTIANTAPDQTVALTAGTGIGVTGTYPNFTIANTAPSSGGTVTSISTSSPITGGTITGSGTIGLGTVGFANGGTGQTTQQLALNALAGSTTSGQYLRGNGTNVQMSAIQAADVPTLNQNTTGTASNVTGVVAIANGGTGQTSASAAINALLPSQSSFAGRYLTTDGTNTSWAVVTGSGTVNSGTANRLAYYTGTTAVSSANNGSGIGIDATNNRIGVGVSSPAARLDLAAPTGTSPSILLTPSTGATISGTTNGSIWCDTASSNTCLTMRKDSAYTKIITLDRNPDLAVGSGSGVVLADSAGTLSKGADLTALGIFAQTAENQLTNSTTETSIIGTITGTKTLPANFFGVGKTITVYVSGQYNQTTSNQTCTIRVSIGSTSTIIASVILNHNNQITTSNFWEASFTITCYSTGTTGTVRGCGKSMLLTDSTARTWYIDADPANSAVTINTTIANTLEVTGQWSGTATTANDLRTSIAYANYIN